MNKRKQFGKLGGGLKNSERKQRFSLTSLITVFVFIVLLIAVGFALAAVWTLAEFGVIINLGERSGLILSTVLIGVISIVIGSGLSLLFMKIPLKPINDIINHMNRLAAGDFSTRLKFGNIISDHPTFNEISVSFNKLAEELENTEMLRGDFVNNFSHEFKTPIVSIAGLAKLVSKGNLTEKQREKYLAAIEEESMRLADMATNVLNLTKVENQTILSDITRFNVSEQVRSAVLLLENKWERKNIAFKLDFDEYEIEANEELLKQVWINLLDNAIKFSPCGSEVCVEISAMNETLTVDVINTGSEISPENMTKIWNKFYQADESHASEGNGVGLAIVKKIVELHGGDVRVKSARGIVCFTVELSLA
jgi:signal transduction histidine kinase